ncbi:MAG: sigma-70 family RNA polymerase sigma factor [Actinobacteria bacterium]|nr:sigma-70 family RNA polymerase sigma factor [Actinomycetota bacterium]
MAPLEELAQRTADGDQDAFAEIYGTLLEPIYRYLYWNLASREDAEDLAEEVFLRCLVNISSYDPKRGPFKAWAFRIAHNLMVDHQRRRGRRGQEELKDDVENGAPTAPQSLEEDERAQALRESLDGLPSSQRQVIVMKFFAEMSNAEVAKAIGRSEGAVNAMQHRALRRLGKNLEEKGWK